MTDKAPDFVDNLARFRKDKPSAPKKIDAPRSTTPASTEPRVKKLDHESIMDHLAEIPQVRGYRLMLIPVGHSNMTKGGIALPDDVVKKQLNHAQIFRVVAMGQAAYQDETRFPHGAYCELGDYVLIGRYAGTRVTTHYCEDLRIVNDDEIMAVIPDVESTLDLV